MQHVARFLGGVLGGQEKRLPGLHPSRQPYYAPVLTRRWVGAFGSDLPWPSMYERDEYLWEGEQRNGAYIYRHVRPNVEGMAAELARLRKELHACQNPKRKGLRRFSR